jgi:hypothetical protein
MLDLAIFISLFFSLTLGAPVLGPAQEQNLAPVVGEAIPSAGPGFASKGAGGAMSEPIEIKQNPVSSWAIFLFEFFISPIFGKFHPGLFFLELNNKIPCLFCHEIQFGPSVAIDASISHDVGLTASLTQPEFPVDVVYSELSRSSPFFFANAKDSFTRPKTRDIFTCPIESIDPKKFVRINFFSKIFLKKKFFGRFFISYSLV